MQGSGEIADAGPTQEGYGLVDAVLAASQMMVAVAARSLDATASDVTLPQFRAIVVRAGTPPDVVKQLADALQQVAATPEFKAYLAQQYADPDSYIGRQGAPAFMQSWLKQAEDTLKEMH